LLRTYIWDRETDTIKPVDTLTWGRYLEEGDRTLQITEFNGVTVSTVFIGLDYNWYKRPGGPIVWETMVFGGERDGLQRRYQTKEEAIAGHDQIVSEMSPLLIQELWEESDNTRCPFVLYDGQRCHCSNKPGYSPGHIDLQLYCLDPERYHICIYYDQSN
jgi:hypothetical protein